MFFLTRVIVLCTLLWLTTSWPPSIHRFVWGLSSGEDLCPFPAVHTGVTGLT